MEWKLIQHLKITENGLNKGELHLSYKGNQNIFNNFNVLSADFLRVQCIKSNSESHILNESSREGPTWVWQDVGWGLKRGGMWDTRFFKGEMRDKDENYNFPLASMSEWTPLSVRYYQLFEDFSYQWLLL